MSRFQTMLRDLRIIDFLPNLVTLAGLCLGLTSIRFVLDERYELAAALIVVAALVDAIDGRLARRLKKTSDFGAELDSLADFLNFGVAPALLVSEYVLRDAGGIGWMFVLVYAICSCLRLARFNVTQEPAPRNRSGRECFVGVPAPAGALLALLPAFLAFEGVYDASAAPLGASVYLGLIGAAMVSTIPTPKAVAVPRDRRAPVLIIAAILAGGILTRFWLSMIVIVLIYLGAFIASVLRAGCSR